MVSVLRQVEVASDADVSKARRAVREALQGHPEEAVDRAEIVMSELATNALFHGGGVAAATIAIEGGIARIEVGDYSRRAPLLAAGSPDAMTGRGLDLVVRIVAQWGVLPASHGKVVWAEVDTREAPPDNRSAKDILDAWPDLLDDPDDVVRVPISLGEVPTELLVAAKRHIDNLVREFELAAGGGRSGTTAPLPTALGELLDRVVNRFEDARLEIKRQATEAARAGASHTRLELKLPLDIADAAQEYLHALDEIDGYSRANRLLTLETPPQHRVFRHWYVGEIVRQLRAAERGHAPPDVVPFEARLLAEVDAAETSRRAADRAARLYSVAVVLASATTAEEVAAAVLTEGVGALGASGGGVLLATDAEHLAVPGTVGYDELTVEKLRNESRDAEVPAAYALRTGEAVWLETIEERDARFPSLAGLEPNTIAMCAVPVAAGGALLGALRFSFTDRRLFDDDEQRFVLALAAEAAEALQRAQLLDSERRTRHRLERLTAVLQQSLLPEALPTVDGADLGAVYSASGEGEGAGGDFYDIFRVTDNAWGLAMGDVRGRGAQAAALTSLARYTIRTAATLGRSPGEVLEVLNDAFHSDDDPERFCSAIFAVLELTASGATLTYANAGHPPIAAIRSGSAELLAPTGGLVGIELGAKFAERQVDVTTGEAVVLYTDGITESRNGSDEFGEARLVDLLQLLHGEPAQTIADRLTEAARGFSGNGATDDSAVFVVAIT